MRTPIALTAIALAALLLPGCATSPAPDTTPTPSTAATPILPATKTVNANELLGTPLEPLAQYLGDWEINATWTNGTTLWARNEYRSMLGGKFVYATTYVSDNAGPTYPRYITIYSWDPAQSKIIAHGFDQAGATTTVTMNTLPDGAIMSQWSISDDPNSPRIRQQISAVTNDSYRWQVWMLPPAPAEPSQRPTPIQMMDGRWERVTNVYWSQDG